MMVPPILAVAMANKVNNGWRQAYYARITSEWASERQQVAKVNKSNNSSSISNGNHEKKTPSVLIIIAYGVNAEKIDDTKHIHTSANYEWMGEWMNVMEMNRI